MAYKTIEDTIGNTPLVQLVRLADDDIRSRNNVILGKLEGNNPAGSVKDRPALSMIKKAEERGRIKPGDTLIEATSGNTGIALAMAAAMRGYKMVLIMPEDLSVERRQSMAAYGAQIVLTPRHGRHGVRARSRRADAARRQGHHPRPVRQPGQSARSLRNHGPGNLARHRRPHHALRLGDGHDRHDHGRVAVSEGTESRRSRSSVRSRKRARAFRASANGRKRICRRFSIAAASIASENVSQAASEAMARRMASVEGIFSGISSGGACEVALRVARQVENATIVFIVCDRGDRYLSTGVFPA